MVHITYDLQPHSHVLLQDHTSESTVNVKDAKSALIDSLIETVQFLRYSLGSTFTRVFTPNYHAHCSSQRRLLYASIYVTLTYCYTCLTVVGMSIPSFHYASSCFPYQRRRRSLAARLQHCSRSLTDLWRS